LEGGFAAGAPKGAVGGGCEGAVVTKDGGKFVGAAGGTGGGIVTGGAFGCPRAARGAGSVPAVGGGTGAAGAACLSRILLSVW